MVALPGGQCTMQADSDALVLRVEGHDDEGRRRLEQLVGDHLQRFGRRDELTLTWRATDETA